MEKTGIFSLVKIFSKNAEMQLPEKKLYKFLAAFAALGIMIPCTVIVGFISYVMTEALIEAGTPGGGMLFLLHGHTFLKEERKDRSCRQRWKSAASIHPS